MFELYLNRQSNWLPFNDGQSLRNLEEIAEAIEAVYNDLGDNQKDL